MRNAICPFAVQTPSGTFGLIITPRAVVLHSDTANGNIPQPHNGLEWHFHIHFDGTIRQLGPVNRHADANFSANGFAVAIETSSNPGATDDWNTLQLVSIIRLLLWLNAEWNIPLRKIETWNGSGIGYHRQFHEWDQSGHSCPGNARVGQYDSYIIPTISSAIPPVVTTVIEEDMKSALVVDSAGYVWTLTPGALHLGRSHVPNQDSLGFILGMDTFTGGTYLVSRETFKWSDVRIADYFIAGPGVSNTSVPMTADQIKALADQIANETTDQIAKRLGNG